jgi:hypothetical protein
VIEQSARRRVLRRLALTVQRTRNVPRQTAGRKSAKNPGNAMYIIREISLRVFNMEGSANWFYSVVYSREISSHPKESLFFVILHKKKGRAP